MLTSVKRLDDLMDLRADYEEKLRVAETARIDAIRAVDVDNVQRAAEVQATQALALATQVTTSAETLRNQVVAAQAANNTALAAALDPIQKAIEDLRRVQYEGVGQKTQVIETQAGGRNAGMWIGIGISVGVAFLSLLALVLTVLSRKP